MEKRTWYWWVRGHFLNASIAVNKVVLRCERRLYGLVWVIVSIQACDVILDFFEDLADPRDSDQDAKL